MYVLHQLVHRLHAMLHNGEDEMVTLVAKYRGLSSHDLALVEKVAMYVKSAKNIATGRKLVEDVLIAMQAARTL